MNHPHMHHSHMHAATTAVAATAAATAVTETTAAVPGQRSLGRRPAGLEQRLRDAGLRATRARLQVLEILADVAPQPMDCQDIFMKLARHDSHASLGTVYRVVQELLARDFLRCIWDDRRKARYRYRSGMEVPLTLRLACQATGQSMEISDPVLLEHLADVARRHGLDAGPGSLRLEVVRSAVAQPSTATRQGSGQNLKKSPKAKTASDVTAKTEKAVKAAEARVCVA